MGSKRIPKPSLVLCPRFSASSVDEDYRVHQAGGRPRNDVIPSPPPPNYFSYSYMEMIVSKWDELGVLKRVLEKKLIFIETKVSQA